MNTNKRYSTVSAQGKQTFINLVPHYTQHNVANVHVQLPFIPLQESKRHFPIQWCATLEAYSIKQHSKGTVLKNGFCLLGPIVLLY
jgi:hypothetical protein